jgi:hypothetical protein
VRFVNRKVCSKSSFFILFKDLRVRTLSFLSFHCVALTRARTESINIQREHRGFFESTCCNKQGGQLLTDNHRLEPELEFVRASASPAYLYFLMTSCSAGYASGGNSFANFERPGVRSRYSCGYNMYFWEPNDRKIGCFESLNLSLPF